MAPSSARAAMASVVPVSPSPALASSALRSASAAISTRQQRRRNASVSGCAEGVGRIGASPSGSGTVATAPRRAQPGQALSGTGRESSASSSSSAG